MKIIRARSSSVTHRLGIFTKPASLRALAPGLLLTSRGIVGSHIKPSSIMRAAFSTTIVRFCLSALRLAGRMKALMKPAL